jgi:hypothetical protein
MNPQLLSDLSKGAIAIGTIGTGNELHAEYEAYMQAAWLLGVPFEEGKKRQIRTRFWGASAFMDTWNREAAVFEPSLINDEEAREAVAGAREAMRRIMNLKALRSMYGELSPEKVKEFKHRAGTALTAMAKKAPINEDIRFVANLGANLL